MKINKGRNGNIELLRFFFCFFIVIHHSTVGGNMSGLVSPWGFLGVEFFFMITGYYLAKYIFERYIDINKNIYTLEEVYSDDVKYVFNKIRSLYPAYLLSCFISFMFHWYAQGFSSSALKALLLFTPGDLMFLQCFGFPCISFTGVMWYLSALYFSLFLIYPILRIHYYSFTKWGGIIVFLTVIGILLHTRGTVGGVLDFSISFWSDGIIRSIGMISIGCVSYEASKYVELLSKTRSRRICCTVLELAVYTAVFLAMIFGNSNYNSLTSMIVLLIASGIIVTQSHMSLLSGKLDCYPVLRLGDITKYWFMNHFYWFKFEKILFNGLNLSPIIEKTICFLGGLLVSILIMLITEAPQSLSKIRKSIASM